MVSYTVVWRFRPIGDEDLATYDALLYAASVRNGYRQARAVALTLEPPTDKHKEIRFLVIVK